MPKARVSHNLVMYTLGLFLHLCPFHVTQLITRSIEKTSTTSRRQSKKSQAKPKSPYAPKNSDWNTRTTSSGHDIPIADLSRNPHDKVGQQPLPLPVESILSILRTVKRHYSRSFNYRAYRLAKQSTRYDKTVSS